MTEPSAPTGVLPVLEPGANDPGDGQALTGARQPWRWWVLAVGVLLSLVLATALVVALFVAR